MKILRCRESKEFISGTLGLEPSFLHFQFKLFSTSCISHWVAPNSLPLFGPSLVIQEVFLNVSALMHLATYLNKHFQDEIVFYLENWGVMAPATWGSLWRGQMSNMCWCQRLLLGKRHRGRLVEPSGDSSVRSLNHSQSCRARKLVLCSQRAQGCPGPIHPSEICKKFLLSQNANFLVFGRGHPSPRPQIFVSVFRAFCLQETIKTITSILPGEFCISAKDVG